MLGCTHRLLLLVLDYLLAAELATVRVIKAWLAFLYAKAHKHIGRRAGGSAWLAVVYG